MLRATFGRFPGEHSLWEGTFWLQKSRVRAGSALALTRQHKSCSDSAPGLQQQLEETLEANVSCLELN